MDILHCSLDCEGTTEAKIINLEAPKSAPSGASFVLGLVPPAPALVTVKRSFSEIYSMKEAETITGKGNSINKLIYPTSSAISA